MRRLILWLRGLVPTLRQHDEHEASLAQLCAQIDYLETLREQILSGEVEVKTDRVEVANELMLKIIQGRRILQDGRRLSDRG